MAEIDHSDAEEGFEYALRDFLECVRAIATGDAEGRPFSYFIAQEYLWELNRPWLLSTTAGYLSSFERAAIHRFIDCIAPVRNIVTALQYQHGKPAWPDWRQLPAFSEWDELSVRANALLDQLHACMQRNARYFISLG